MSFISQFKFDSFTFLKTIVNLKLFCSDWCQLKTLQLLIPILTLLNSGMTLGLDF